MKNSWNMYLWIFNTQRLFPLKRNVLSSSMSLLIALRKSYLKTVIKLKTFSGVAAQAPDDVQYPYVGW